MELFSQNKKRMIFNVHIHERDIKPMKNGTEMVEKKSNLICSLDPDSRPIIQTDLGII